MIMIISNDISIIIMICRVIDWFVLDFGLGGVLLFVLYCVFFMDKIYKCYNM